MRLTRGCRAGGGVACSSLEYGGIRAATRCTPAPRNRLLLSRLRLASSCTSTTSFSLSLSSRPLSSSTTIFSLTLSLSLSPAPTSYYTPPGTSARSCYHPPPAALPRILRLCADNSDDDDDVPISLHEGTADSLFVLRSDREDGQKKRAKRRGKKREKDR